MRRSYLFQILHTSSTGKTCKNVAKKDVCKNFCGPERYFLQNERGVYSLEHGAE